jgi:predicted ArsR family transcriptional regulator
MKFADTLTISVKELDDAILNLLKGNPTITVEEIAKTLNYDNLKVNESLTRLKSGGFIESDTFKPTIKGINKDTEPPKQYEIYTVYKYALRDDENVTLKKGGSSRQFCKDLMRLTNGYALENGTIKKGKNWTFEKIDAMENDLGTNVFDYRGGYYTNPNTKETTPDCRHVWQAITKRRLVKK